MTDRHSGYVVTLDKDIREDDAENIVTALKLIKGVAGVKPVVTTPEIDIAKMRARTAIVTRVLDALKDV